MRRLAATALVLGLCLAGWATADPGGPGPLAAAARRPAVKMSGYVGGLYPGGRKRLTLMIRNRTRSRVVLRGLRVRAKRARRGCEARQLKIGRLPRRVRIAARRRVRVRVTIRLRGSAPDACKRARFPLRVRARVGQR
jgi:hypothetical protein